MDRDKAIRNTHPKVSSINAETDARDSDGNVVELNEALITAEMKRLQAEYDTQEYARNRERDYPKIVDQFDDIFHNGINGWKKSIQKIKDKYPKGF